MPKSKILSTISSSILSTLLILSVLISGCGDNGGPTEPDYSTVPPAYDTTDTQKQSLDNGVTYYIIQKGSGPFEVSARDRIEAHYTLRLKSTGEIEESSYADGNTDPDQFNLPSTITGFRSGLIGMKIGEKRKIIVPPEQGYEQEDHKYHGKTLIFDIKLADIL